MGEIADMMLDGTLCEGCGEFLNNDGPGYPCYCSECGGPGGDPHKGYHRCHWVGCEKNVNERFWGCPKHWKMLPLVMRKMIWKHYKPGQDNTKKVSGGYLSAARQIREWIMENHSGDEK